jgi:hypothetical protein
VDYKQEKDECKRKTYYISKKPYSHIEIRTHIWKIPYLRWAYMDYIDEIYGNLPQNSS